jgi:perosamine synthetase
MISQFDKSLYNLVATIREIYGDGFVPLHRPIFEGMEREYLIGCVDSNFVSSVGERVMDFQKAIAKFTGIKYAIATVNGTAALHASLLVSGVKAGEEVLTQALTFVATANAISYCGARPVFIDVDRDTLGLSPAALRNWLEKNTYIRNGQSFNKRTDARISACVPMHTFGLPLRIDQVVDICKEYNITVVEDAAEALGSFASEQHVGSHGHVATLSFNGNKLITTGGGGMILTNNQEIAEKALHMTTTAKVPHAYEFVHDAIGYNYRMPNLNAALGCAQIEMIDVMLEAKEKVASIYRRFCDNAGLSFIDSISDAKSNYWLNAICLKDKASRNYFLDFMNDKGVMCRPIWRLMSELPMFEECETDGLKNSRWLENRIVNIPSSVPAGFKMKNKL